MKILITGIAGFIGSNTARFLKNSGHEVCGLDNFDDYYPIKIKQRNKETLTKLDIEVEKIDLVTENTILSAFLNAKNPDIVIHLAARPGISASVTFDEYVSNNLVATHNLLECLKTQKSLKLLIQASTSSVYGSDATKDETKPAEPTSYYGVTKLASEQLALAYYREFDLPVSVLRFFSVYGPGERPEKLFVKLIKCGLKNEKFPLFDGSLDHIRSFTFVDDIASSINLSINNVEKVIGEIFNVGSDQSFSVKEGVSIVEETLGKKINFEILEKRVGDQSRTIANISKIRSILGYEPRYSLAEGIKLQASWVSENLDILD